MLFSMGIVVKPTIFPLYPSTAQICVTPNMMSFSFGFEVLSEAIFGGSLSNPLSHWSKPTDSELEGSIQS